MTSLRDRKLGLMNSPSNLNLIDRNLYLGAWSAATDVKTLQIHKITHILTIEDAPLPDNIQSLKNVITKYIQLPDMPKSDLLSHFDETYNFIHDGVANGVVLVHCLQGVSRSATIVTAYIMKTYNLSPEEALKRVRKKRTQVYPNSGFMSQLGMYYKMGYKIVQCREDKLFRLRTAADQVKKLKVLPVAFFDIVKADVEKDQIYYRCKKCGRGLAAQVNTITHKYKGEICNKTHFVEPLAWMGVIKETKSELHCPECKEHVGGFNWIGGYRCACDVTMWPAFYLDPVSVSRAKDSK